MLLLFCVVVVADAVVFVAVVVVTVMPSSLNRYDIALFCLSVYLLFYLLQFFLDPER